MQGLLIVYTGHGKGKTTAAFGAAFRALGHGKSVCVVHFIKGKWNYGELKAAEQFKDRLEVHVLGAGFTWESKDLANDIEVARDAWATAEQIIRKGKHFLVVLDELTYLIKYGMIEEERILQTLRRRRKRLHVIVTGRDASPGLIEAADLVTDMHAIKHPLDAGIKAQKGIEF